MAYSDRQEPQRFVFFGGQGSRACSSYNANDNEQQIVTSLLLASCHSAFVEEIMRSRSTHGIPPWANFEVPASADDMLRLSPIANGGLSKSPILDGVCLCLDQLVTYVQNDPALEQQRRSTTAGFCSGLLPAVVVASSRTVEEYINYSKGVIRVAYWIGFRAAELSYNVGGSQWMDLPWALSVLGLEKDHLTKAIVNFNLTVPHHMSISLSCRFGRSSFSLVGPGSSLDKFRSHYLPRNSTASWVHVQALYHAGDRGKVLTEKVLLDIEAGQNFVFPTVHDLHRPLWWCHVDSCIDSSTELDLPLLEYVLKLIMECDADLYGTWGKVLDFIPASESPWDVITIGPGSYTLLASVCRDLVPPEKLNFIDLSPLPQGADRDMKGYAIVGMSVNFPSGGNKTEFWETLKLGRNTVQKIPSTRFQVDDYQPESSQFGPRRETRVHHGNFLPNPFAFDHSFFGISPREAKSMDPQQKLLLQGAVHALEDAGYVPHSTPTFNPETMGCYVGVATSDYVHNLARGVDVYYATGTLRAFLSGKISYAFGWSGPSIVTDTACSSSLVSIALACRALANGDVSAALAGGVNAITSPDMYLGLSRAHFLSTTGQCRPFDALADGYCRAEGCGLFVIKRLEDAIQEDDHIYGVIRGVEYNQSGNALSITHPCAETQQSLFQRLFTRANIDPTSVCVVEAHGTGTQAGDAVEAASLEMIFGDNSRPLYLTSIKGNIGHAEAASGAAGLAKLLMMLQHSQIPRQVGLTMINPKLQHLATKNIYIPTESLVWKHTGHTPRRGMLNNFGAAGSNAALLLEEFPPSHRKVSRNTERGMYNFILSAKSEKALSELIQNYQKMLSMTTPDIQDLCYTVTARRQLYDYSAFLICNDVEGLSKKLQMGDFVRSPPKERKRIPIIFVFSGQGSVYKGMGKQLLTTAPVFNEKVDECDRILRQIEKLDRLDIREYINGSSTSSDAKDELVLSQAACFTIEYALASLWISWGIRPDALLGHSLGEYVAMVISGALNLQDGLSLIAHRAHLMATACALGESTMIACNKAGSQLEKIFVRENLSQLAIACRNSITDSVVSGPIEEITRLQEILRAESIRCKTLDVPLGYHSEALDPITDTLNEWCRNQLHFSAPRIPLSSCLYGRWMNEADLHPSYVSKQTRNTVQFANLIDRINEHPQLQSAACIEIGPTPTTLQMIKQGLSSPGCLFLPSLIANQNAWKTLCSSLQQLALQHVSITWRQVFRGSGAKHLVTLPEYPFQQESLHIPFVEAISESKSKGAMAPQLEPFFLLKDVVSCDDSQPPYQFRTDLGLLSDHIRGHMVGGFALCPASVFHGMALEAILCQRVIPPDRVAAVVDLEFARPLLYQDAEREKEVFLTVQQDAPDRFPSNFAFRGSDNAHFCAGRFEWHSKPKFERYLSGKQSYIERQIAYIQANSNKADLLRTGVIYNTIFPRVVAYSKEYQSLKELWIMDDVLDAWGTFEVPESLLQRGAVSPVFVDTLLHAAGFLANSRACKSDVFICAEVESMRVIYPLDSRQKSFKVYCSLLGGGEGIVVGQAFAMTTDHTVVATLEGMIFKQLSLKTFNMHLSRHTSINSSAVYKTSSQRIHSPPTSLPTTHFSPVVMDAIAEICERSTDQIKLDCRLSDLGIDSLMLIELSITLKKKLPTLSLDSNDMMNAKTARDLQQYVMAQCERSSLTDSGSESTDQDKSSSITPVSTQLQPEPVFERVVDLVSDICEVDRASIHSETILKELGIDSLMAIELQSALNRELGKPSSILADEQTIQDLVDQFDVSPASPRSKNMICLHSGDRILPPLILFHDGSGLVDQYRRLLPFECTVYGICCPDSSDSAAGLRTMVELAKSYASLIMQTLPKQRLALGGWSFGGVLAHEVANQLDREGYQTAGVILIDSPCPLNHEPLPKAVIELALASTSKAKSTMSLLLDRFQRHANMLAQYQHEGNVPASRKYVLLHCENILDTSILCGVDYPWLSSKEERLSSISRWNQMLNIELSVINIPGTHFQVFDEGNISTVSQSLKTAYQGIL